MELTKYIFCMLARMFLRLCCYIVSTLQQRIGWPRWWYICLEKHEEKHDDDDYNSDAEKDNANYCVWQRR
jgi:hypothetical protein